MKQIKELLYLVDAFKSLPNIGEKTAMKLAVFLLNQDNVFKSEFVKRINKAINNLTKCKYCNTISETEICCDCSSKKINKSLCIVINYDDYIRIEETKNYNGYFNILMYPIHSKQIDTKLININQIIEQIKFLDINEIIIATPFSILGEMIANFLNQQLSNIVDHIYRIGFGIPLNANIDYIDDDTIRESFINKKRIR